MYAQLERHLHFQHTALAVLGQRQQLLAANIANADTPHYQARDLDFRAVLSTVAAQTGGSPLRTTHPLATVDLGDYPGLGPRSAGITAVDDPDLGWCLRFDWSQIDRATGFVAVVVTATTTDSGADPGKRSASQAVLVRVPIGGAASPPALRIDD